MLQVMATSIVEEVVLRTAEKHGVPRAVAQELLAGSRPCVHLVPFQSLTLAQQEGARPAARTGGVPSLPDGADWWPYGAPESAPESAPAGRGEPLELTAVPYYAWANRTGGSMRVWLPTD